MSKRCFFVCVGTPIGVTLAACLLVAVAVYLLCVGTPARNWATVPLTYEGGPLPSAFITSVDVSEEGEVFFSWMNLCFVGVVSVDDIVGSVAVGASTVDADAVDMCPPFSELEDIGWVHHPKVAVSADRVLFLANSSWGAELGADRNVGQFRIDLSQLPEITELQSLTFDQESNRYYAIGRTRDTKLLLVAHAIEDSVVVFGPLGGDPLTASGLGRAKLVMFGHLLAVLNSEIIDTGSTVPREMFKPGPVTLSIYDRAGNLKESFNLDHSGTRLADVGSGNSLQRLGDRLFVKVGARVWLYDNANLRKVFEDDELQGWPAAITEKGILVLPVAARGRWLGITDFCRTSSDRSGDADEV